MTEWISVKDRLPEAYKPVLLFACPKYPDECQSFASDGPVFAGEYRQRGWWGCLYGDGWIPFSNDEITHWMPLPEPPK